jgi:SAM-dependent methyltransferase
MPSKKIKVLYDDYARTCDPGDLLGQVRRTIGGQPVDENQVEMIVEALLLYLELKPDDILLDLCCGNGLLTNRVFERCAGGVGVDMGEYLISIARKHFEKTPCRKYVVSDVESFVDNELEPERFTKALCYASFAYLSNESAGRVLNALRHRFHNITRLVLGNLPDKAMSRAFFDAKSYVDGIEDDHETVLGRWRTETEVKQLAEAAGWKIKISRMAQGYYAAHYRFDALLTPLE